MNREKTWVCDARFSEFGYGSKLCCLLCSQHSWIPHTEDPCLTQQTQQILFLCTKLMMDGLHAFSFIICFLTQTVGWFDTKNHQPYVLKDACGHSFFFPASDVSSKAGRSIGGSSPGGTWPVARWTVGQSMWGFNQQTPGFSQKTLGFKQSANQMLHEVMNSRHISMSISISISISIYIYIYLHIYIYHHIIYIYIHSMSAMSSVF